MIRAYKAGDEDRLEANEFSSIDDVTWVFEDDSFEKYTVEKNDEVLCIICWTEYCHKQYAIFFLIKEGAGMSEIKAIKKFLDQKTKELKPKTCITYSFDCDMLNRWHKFFGFERQRKILLNAGYDQYNKWMIKWA